MLLLKFLGWSEPSGNEEFSSTMGCGSWLMPIDLNRPIFQDLAVFIQGWKIFNSRDLELGLAVVDEDIHP